ncbi:hypothetical protein [Sphingomonas sanxanigenens]|nr:hypothetical protein [Sphingomonas sanxanigenens]
MSGMDLFATSSAIISPCSTYRYRLERDGPGIGAGSSPGAR